MTSLHTALENEIEHNIQYGEALLVALKLRAEHQMEVMSASESGDLLALCRLVLDIQAVECKLGRERYRLSLLNT